jgi:putative endonuclease
VNISLDRIETGVLGEKLALGVLKKRGYHILETNFRCREGEIDIVAKQRDCLVFVEVRAKRSLAFGTPEESLSPRKQARVRRAARRYVQTHKGLPESWRIDFVGIELSPEGVADRVTVIESAVGER